jgi:predicted deacetylase
VPAFPSEPAGAAAPSAARPSGPIAAPRRALCVAIHDVAPATWDDCSRLRDAVRAVADIPLTWLVVPCYHGCAASPLGFERGLDALLDAGHELALHGYTHLDTAPSTFASALLRKVYTQSEGEFAAIDESEARRKIALGLDWFARRRWPVSGFVAPAWLLGAHAWRALRGYPFAYTTTVGRFHLLQRREALVAPSLVYAARNHAGRLVSPPLARAAALLYRRAPLLRLALHPRDARHPALLRHAQTLIAQLLDERTPMTKATFAHSYPDTMPYD